MFKSILLFTKKPNEWYKMYKLLVYDMYIFTNNLKNEELYKFIIFGEQTVLYF